MRRFAADDPISAEQHDADLAARQERTLLRLIACGSAEDGKTTLVSRLLEDAATSDEERPDTGAASTADGAIAYRHLSTPHRDYLIADISGDEQYTRTMVTGAAEADCAIIVIDARKGLVAQTRWHAHVTQVLGIRDVALIVNKLDLVGYSIDRYREIEEEFRAFASAIGLERITCIPVSAREGENVVSRSARIRGYGGPSLLDYLESIDVDPARARALPLRLPVQSVDAARDGAQTCTGTLSSGLARPGDRVTVAPAGLDTHIARIITPDGDGDLAVAGESISVTLADDVDVSRGDVIGAHGDPPSVADRFRATIVWMGAEPMLRGRTYVMRIGAATVPATVSPLKYKLSITTLERLAATSLTCTEIGACDLELADRIAFDPHNVNRHTGGFALLDRITGETVAAGMIEFALRRSQNVAWQGLTIDKPLRARSLQQKPFVMWLTGLPGAGKSTIANLVEAELHRRGRHTYLLDGDNVRHGLNSDLGFTAADRVENIRRVAEVARLMVDAGLIVLVSFISPFRAERRMARSLFEPGEFFEIHVDAPLAVAERRDPKGLYRKARSGELRNFTGVDSPYEPPENPELTIATDRLTPPEAMERVIAMAEAARYL